MQSSVHSRKRIGVSVTLSLLHRRVPPSPYPPCSTNRLAPYLYATYTNSSTRLQSLFPYTYQAQAKLGNRWRNIARIMPGRTENAVKNRWNGKKLRQGDVLGGAVGGAGGAGGAGGVAVGRVAEGSDAGVPAKSAASTAGGSSGAASSLSPQLSLSSASSLSPQLSSSSAVGGLVAVAPAVVGIDTTQPSIVNAAAAASGAGSTSAAAAEEGGVDAGAGAVGAAGAGAAAASEWSFLSEYLTPQS